MADEKQSAEKKHKWTNSDNIIAFFLYKYNSSSLLITPEELNKIGETMGIPDGKGAGTLRMKIQNFSFLDGKGKLSKASIPSKRVYEQYKTFSELDLIMEISNKKFLKYYIDRLISCRV